MGGIRWSTATDVVVRLIESGLAPDADDATRIRTSTVTLAAGTVFVLAFIWTGMYLALGLLLPAAIPATYQAATAAGFVHLARTKRFEPFLRLQLVLMGTFPFLLQLSLGGFVASSVVCLWALVAGLGAAFFAGVTTARRWFAVFVVLLVVSGLVEPIARSWAAPIPDPLQIALFVLNVGCVALTLFAFVIWALRELDEGRDELARERERADGLLRSILPAGIAERLKIAPGSIAEAHEAVTVLFVDLVDFTPLAAQSTATDLVAGLDELFAVFDGIAERRGVEKIKTLGDAWLAVAGLPQPRPDHVAAALDVALAVRDAVGDRVIAGRPVRIRIGVATGSVVAGVIGRTKPSYDLWGDTVNQASRLQSTAEPGTIVTTAAVAAAADGYRFVPLGSRTVKGLGTIPAFVLEGPA